MYKEIIEKLKGKNIAILGFGREGKSTYKFIRKYLKDIHLTIIDKKDFELKDTNITKVVGENYLDNLGKYDVIIKSPGISLNKIDTSSFIDKITSQLELLLEVDRKNIIGITGTKGKSTTSTLTYEVLKKQYDDVYLLGNIGTPVLDNVSKYTDETKLVIEMSSHQLEYVKTSPHIAIVLNLYQDHLDHAGTLEHYHQNKMNIFKCQDENDYAIYLDDNEYLHKLVSENDYKAIKYTVRFDNKNLSGNTTRIKGKDVYINNEMVYVDDSRKILGEHNLKNIMFVLTICKIMNLDFLKAHRVIKEFTGLKYRMEYLGKYHEINFYNDTIATIPEATINAVNAIGNVDTLIFGGLDREIDYKDFIQFLLKSKIRNLIGMPTTGTNILKEIENKTDKNIFYANTLEEAHKIAIENTKKNKSCLLSPAAASYEFFKNFEEKGAAFEKIVKNN